MLDKPSYFLTGSIPISLPHAAHVPPLIAILIDGDNTILSEAQLTDVLREAEALGEVAVRRVYGNWAATAKSAWKEVVLKYAFTPYHHIHGAPGKNATDIALTVAAIDLFYQGITIFFLISGDSDYTPLIQRLRASNCQVIGVGMPAKASSLLSACTRFIPLQPANPQQPVPKDKKPSTKKKSPARNAPDVKKAAPKKETTTSAKKASSTAHTPSSKPSPGAPSASSKAVKPLDDPLLTQEIEQAFTELASQQQSDTILLIDIAKAVKDRLPSQRPKDYGKNSWLFVIKARTDLFVVQQVERDGKQLDEIRRRLPNNGPADA